MALARVRCPRCRKEVAWEGNPWRPFCSERCRLVDLGGWATERHRIPGAEEPEEGADEDDGERSS
jgi:endogenous inhibitor of DNA gyrase (YacG/DUF329 family)